MTHVEPVERFLVELSALLATSLDDPDTLRCSARLTVPLLADQCIVEQIDHDGDTPVAVLSSAR
jgi:hypothetical protein